jgi:predicted MPP superfamily phosphohydrolase
LATLTQGAEKPLVPRRISRRKFLGLAAATGVAAVGIDSLAIEPNLPHVVRLEIPLRRWPEHLDGFTIALLSDFHYDRYFSIHPLKSAIGIVNDLKPDLIVLTGDFVSLPLFKEKDKTVADHAEPCAELLKQMHATHGLWAVLGNHDAFSDPDRVTDALRTQGIQVLVNQSAPIETNGARFWLAGVNDVLGEHADLDATLDGIPKDEATVLLAHEPDYADYVKDFPVDLQLSGHSHGGQVRVPLVPVFYLPELGRKYVKGLFHVGPLTLYTNIGLGTVAFPVRLNCPPEITLITVRTSTSK